MLWEVEIQPLDERDPQANREGARVSAEARLRGLNSLGEVRAARSFLVEGTFSREELERVGIPLLVDAVVERAIIRQLPADAAEQPGLQQWNVLFKPGVTDNVGETAQRALSELGLSVSRVATCRKYWISSTALAEEVQRFSGKVLANDAIEQVVRGPLPLKSLALGSEYTFELRTTAIRHLDDAGLQELSKSGQLYLQLAEMRTIRDFFRELGREPTDIELETIAQTWSEHCSHKTLAGRIAYRDEQGERRFQNMLKETVFAATQQLRQQWGAEDWCVSVFRDNAGVVTFDDEFDVCIKVETHNHPSALEPYGGANTGLGGVIRDSLGTGLGARPVCSTDVFCFAPPDTPFDTLPPGVLHPRTVMSGVVAGVRDYGNRMGIPTVNGAVCFDPRYIGNPLVYCGNVAIIPRGMSQKEVHPGDWIVAVGGRTGRDGIHGATFSSAELTQESEVVSGGAVQIGNAVMEKMVMDVILQARDRQLFRGITDCGAGGFSSAVGEMGEETGAEVWLDRAPLKYSGLSYTEIWISEAQERMVLAVPPEHWEEFQQLCLAEGVEATIIGQFTQTQELVLKYQEQEVGRLPMSFLHGGRPPVVRDAVYQLPANTTVAGKAPPATRAEFEQILLDILRSPNVCSKEWIIRQYDHEVQAGSVIKPLVGVAADGPGDAAVVRPRLTSSRGLVVGCGINPHLGDCDPYWMAAAAIDEAVRNCVAVGADPARIALLDNFCWGNTEHPETLGTLVRAALGCHDTAIAYGTPFVSGKDSLNNNFRYVDERGVSRTVTIPSTLLITALGQVAEIETCVTMDLKEPGNLLYQIGSTYSEWGGSHYHLVRGESGGEVPRVDFHQAPKTFAAVHAAIQAGTIRSCHDLSEGGLAVALAEMAFAGGYGAAISLAAFGKLDEPTVLFAESNTRFVVEVPPEREAEFLRIVPGAFRLGTVIERAVLEVSSLDGTRLVDLPLDRLKTAWQETLRG